MNNILGEEASVFVEGFTPPSTTMNESKDESNNTPNLQGFGSPDLLPDSHRKEVVFTGSPEGSKITSDVKKSLFSIATLSEMRERSMNIGRNLRRKS